VSTARAENRRGGAGFEPEAEMRAGTMARDLLRCGEQGDDTAIAAGKSIVVLRRRIEQQSIPAKSGVEVVSAGFVSQ